MSVKVSKEIINFLQRSSMVDELCVENYHPNIAVVEFILQLFIIFSKRCYDIKGLVNRLGLFVMYTLLKNRRCLQNTNAKRNNYTMWCELFRNLRACIAN